MFKVNKVYFYCTKKTHYWINKATGLEKILPAR